MGYQGECGGPSVLWRRRSCELPHHLRGSVDHPFGPQARQLAVMVVQHLPNQQRQMALKQGRIEFRQVAWL
jgi:hypothetical protein